MISNAFLFMIDRVISVVVYPIANAADAELPSIIATSIAGINSGYTTASQVFSVPVLFGAVLLLITIEGFIAIFKGFRLGGKHVPGIS